MAYDWGFLLGTFFRTLERGTLTEDDQTNANDDSDQTSEDEGACGEASAT